MTVFSISLIVAVAAAATAYVFVRPVRPLDVRIRPYAHLARTRMGRGAEVSAIALVPEQRASVSGEFFGPILQSVADSLSRLVDAGGETALAKRLRDAGMHDMSIETYRMRQFGYTVGGSVGGVLVGIMLGSTALALFCGALGALWGGTVMRGRTNKAIRDRCTAMRTELYTVAQLIAMYIRAGRGSVQAVQMICDRGHGPVVDELREALAWMSSGRGQADAYDDLARLTAEPGAARLYRMLADGARSGGDLAESLLSVSDDLRSDRREDLERINTKKRGAMIVPTIVVMAPVVLLWIAAPLPAIVLGLGK